MNPDFVHTFDPAAHTGPLPSPCINICQMDARTGYCLGCWRTIDEIVCWGGAREDLKRAIWTEIRRRADAAFD